MTNGIVIIGGGQAASSAAAKIRELDATIPITIFGGERALPYQRPPLSKAYLAGEMTMERLIFRPEQWFDENAVELKTGTFVDAIDRVGKTVTLDDGTVVPYGKLLLATGSRPRKLPRQMTGDLEGIFYLRTARDADRMRTHLQPGHRMAVIGGGYIGLEVAAMASKLGLEVVVIEAAERILQRVASPSTSDFFRTLHHSHGVQILENASVAEIKGEDGKVNSLQLGDERTLPVDLILVGIGVEPQTGLAEDAGLDLQNGIWTDEFCATSDENIFAAGDCASFNFGGEVTRLESVPNAIHQGETAAANMLGQSVVYEAEPWFWSDQYDVKLQIAGLNRGYDDTIVRPGKREGAQSVWYYKGEQLIAVDAMNDAPSFMLARKILQAGKTVPKEVVADADTNLREWA